jgi:DNA/RNA-binding domain of Phe-tRNA-synthetase-like protein
VIECRIELPLWRLHFVLLRDVGGGDETRIDSVLRTQTAATRAYHGGTAPADDPAVRAVRRACRACGTDPTRYRPAYEALVRRLLRGEDMPRILPLVDVNNAISLALRLPCCVGDLASITPPLVLRRGQEHDRFASLRGDFAGAGKPVLVDVRGVLGTPMVDAERVSVGSGTREALFWAWVPVAHEVEPSAIIEEILSSTGVARAAGAAWVEPPERRDGESAAGPDGSG